MSRSSLIFAFLLMAVAVMAGRAAAQNYSIDWYTIDGGGAMNTTGGTFALSGTIGQPDAQVPPVMTGGTFELTGGFWPVANVCTCPGDLNGDGVRNGADVQKFALCLTAAPGNCSCADVDGANGVTVADVGTFVADLLAGPGCP